ncbi:hypothetical protein [Micromonospora sp. RTP1Z1]|uniref:hypothetical protein n=1 Tax=Micromonospora sp. RTP1Z1 TaxID=2994043 RepID=UPI0029C8A168|nr:hypothetical protein [Micromonospora sp. RTP1Z1]
MIRHDADTQRVARVAAERVVVKDRRRLARLLALYALLPLLCSTAATLIASNLADASMDRRVAALEQDLAQRRAQAAAETRERDARLEQTRRDLCVALDRLTPRDPPVQDLRRRYGCTAPDPRPSPSTGAPERGGPRTPGRAAPSSAPRPAPTPGPTGPRGPQGPNGPPGTPAPTPTPEPTPALLCIPPLRLCL